MIKMILPVFLLLCQVCRAQNDSLIQLRILDQDDPTLSLGVRSRLYVADLNTALDISETLSDSISKLFYSVDYYLTQDECLPDDLKNALIQEYDSLEIGWNMYLETTRRVEMLSYGRGHEGGNRCINMTIRFQRDFLEYLKFWSNSLYYVYLEPGVLPCK